MTGTDRRIRYSLQVVLDIRPSCKKIWSYHRRQERRRTARVFGADAVILSDGSTRIIEVNNNPALRLIGIPEWQVHIKRRMLNHYRTLKNEES